MQSMGEDD